jgi:hypothetical protein
LINYEGIDLDYEVWHRSLSEWCSELVSDRRLFSQMSWNAVRLFGFDGERYIRFYDEPWSGDAWWEVQVWYSIISIILHFVLMCGT